MGEFMSGIRECPQEPSQAAPEDTLFLASDGLPIFTGDVIRAPITINTELHGAWGEYAVRKAPGGYLLSYLRSEKGQILPEGYTGGYMHDVLPDGDEIDLKTLVFTRVPVRVRGWERVKGKPPEGSGRNLADATPIIPSPATRSEEG